MPYRIDLAGAGPEAADRLIELGALDVEHSPGRGVAAVMPDSVAPEQVASAVGAGRISISAAIGRDAASVWVLRPMPVRVGRVVIAPAHHEPAPGVLRLIDAPAFGTGLHPTTAMCLEAIDEFAQAGTPASVLDVGTGSGVLALAALTLGTPRALAIDVDDAALRAAAENARLNGLDRRIRLACGGPESLAGTWPVVLANILAAALVEMAPVLVRRVGHQSRMVLSGIPASVGNEVASAYQHLGMRQIGMKSRAGWVALILQASW